MSQEVTSIIDGKLFTPEYHSYTARDGVELFYQRIGNGKPLLLIHGLGSSSLDWEFQYEGLGSEYELIIPDLRGFGQSMQAYFEMEHPRASMELFAQDVADLLQDLNIDSCPVLGYSMGGPVAFQLALNNLNNSNEHSFKPSALIIVNSLANFKIDSLKKFYLVNLRRLLTKIFSLKKMAVILSKKLFPDNPELGALMAARNGKNKKPPYTDSLNALMRWQAGSDLTRLEQPTVFICADMDYTPPSEKEKSARVMKNAKVVVIENSMHGTPVDQPEVFNQSVLDFLSNI